MSAPEPQPNPQVAIRAKPPSPRRLSRKVLLTGAVVAGAIVAAAVMGGLSAKPPRAARTNDNAVAAAGGPPDSIAQASDGYQVSDLPRAELDFEPAAVSSDEMLAPPRDSLLSSAPPSAPMASRGAPVQSDPQLVASASPILFGAAEASEMRPAAPESDGVLETRLMPPRSPYRLEAGQVIPAALVTAPNSDAPGRVVAQVTAAVYDTATGDHLLIPQGSRLIGTYASGVRYGDRRLVLAWNRLILPNGWSIDLKAMEAGDAAGSAGLSAKVDNHLDRLAAAVALSSVLTVAANEAQDDRPDRLTQSLGDTVAQEAAQTGSRIVDRDLAVRPTLRVRAGAPVRVLVSRDIVLRPYFERVRQ